MQQSVALMRRRGVAGTGIAEVLAGSGAARRSLYQHFPRGKEQLIEESTRAAGRFLCFAIDEAMSSQDAADGVRAVLTAWRGLLESGDFRDGCPVAAAALGGAEAGSAPGAAGEAFTAWTEAITAGLVRHGMDHATGASLATTIVAVVEGATIMAIATRSLHPLDCAEEHVVTLLGLYLGGR